MADCTDNNSVSLAIESVPIFSPASAARKILPRRPRERSSSIQAFLTILNIQLSSRAPLRHWSNRVSALSTAICTPSSASCRFRDGLSALRHPEIGRLIRGTSRVVEADPNGEPVVRNEILGLAPTDAALDHARSIGFVVDREQNIGAMNLRLVVFRAPQGMSTKKALRTLREADPGGSYDCNHIYSGGRGGSRV